MEIDAIGDLYIGDLPEYQGLTWQEQFALHRRETTMNHHAFSRGGECSNIQQVSNAPIAKVLGEQTEGLRNNTNSIIDWRKNQPFTSRVRR